MNSCMWAFVEYAARVKPLVAIFESVRAAYTKGHPLMRDLRARLEARTGLLWNLHHVVHDAYALGGPAIRRRYFWVASRIPFGVEYPELPFAPTLWNAISDLEPLPLMMQAHPYLAPPVPWSERLRSPWGTVDGHIGLSNPFAKRLADLATMIGWRQGKSISDEARRCYETYGTFPASWEATKDKVIEKDFGFGFNGPVRWQYDRPGRVITGAGPNIGVHPTQDRTFTHREIARIMGFPDDWLIEPISRFPGLSATWGKGITVDAGRWIADWARRSILGEPGSLPWTPVGNRELEVTVSKPRICGSVDNAPQPLQNGARRMTTPQAPTPGGPVAPAFVSPAAPQPPAPQPPAAPAAPPAPEAQPAPAANQSTTDAKLRGRGRGRPSDVVERDALVLAAVTPEGISREALAEKTGLDSVRVYQSLWRLRRDGKVVRAREGRGHAWQLPAGDQPVPVQPAPQAAEQPAA